VCGKRARVGGCCVGAAVQVLVKLTLGRKGKITGGGGVGAAGVSERRQEVGDRVAGRWCNVVGWSGGETSV